MNIRILSTTADFAAYDRWVRTHPHGSLWQSLEWKRYQEVMGREVQIYIAEDSSTPSPLPSPQGGGNTIVASAMVVIDRTTGGWSTWDIPRGPLRATSYETRATGLLDRVVADAKNNRCCALYISPPRELPPLEARSSKLETSCRHEQPSATRMIDLTPSDDAILAQMHPKGRYNIRVAQKHGVRVEESRDIDSFYALLRGTAERDGFRILPLKAYKTFLECLPGSFLLMASVPPPPTSFRKKAPIPWPLPPCGGEGELPSPANGGGAGGGGLLPIAGLLGAMWPNEMGSPAVTEVDSTILNEARLRSGYGGQPSAKVGIYYYGASSYAHRALMAPYALQWEAMRRCKGKGCTRYDLLGITHPLVTLRCEPSEPRRVAKCHGSWLGSGLAPHHDTSHHPWAGVSAFKEKFGGMVVTYPPEQQIILRLVLWRVLQWKRRVTG